MVSRDISELLIILLLFLYCFQDGVRGGLSLMVEENFQSHSQWKQLNSGVRKSIKSQDGDIIDCVDINKQPAFDHPLLNNHKIQMKPSSLPSGINNNSFLRNFQHAEIKSIGCHVGTVPILRTRNHDAIQFKSSRQHVQANIHASNGVTEEYYAIQTTKPGKDIYFGSRAVINVYGLPEINEKGQSSIAAIWMTGGGGTPDKLDIIMVGWAVDPSIYGDNKTRLTAYWQRSSSDSHCENLLCPGFVQVSSDIHLGAVIQPVSTYNGQQYYITLYILQDPITSNWWLMYGDDNKPVGYWPKDLFIYLKDGCSVAHWGGKVTNNLNKPWGPMGSGHFPDEGYGKAAFFKKIQIVDIDGVMRLPDGIYTKPDRPDCYKMGVAQNHNDDEGLHFFYGGPAGCVG